MCVPQPQRVASIDRTHENVGRLHLDDVRDLRHIEQRFTRFGVPQSHIADTLGISQPRLNALLHRRDALFSLDALIGLCGQFDLDVRLRVVRPYSKD